MPCPPSLQPSPGSPPAEFPKGFMGQLMLKCSSYEMNLSENGNSGADLGGNIGSVVLEGEVLG